MTPLRDLQGLSVEYKDPMFELLSGLEQIVLKDVLRMVTLPQKTDPFTEFEQLRREAGLEADDFARVMGATVAVVHEWESKHVKPFTTGLELMCLIQIDPRLGEQLMD